MFKKLLLGLTAVAFAQSAVAASIEDRVSELEANQMLNYWSFGGNLQMMQDYLHSKQGSAEDSATWSRMLMSFDFNAKPDSDIQFYGRLTTSKYMNALSDFRSSQFGDLGDARAFNSSAVYLEKAYFDWKASENFIVSAGRLPTINGSPTHLWYGNPRMGTYPKLSYNSILDGVALTYKAINNPESSLALRAILTPLGYVAEERDGFTKATNAGGNEAKSTDGTMAFMLDYSNTQIGFADSFGAIFQYIKVDELILADTTSGGVSVLGSGTTSFNFLTAQLELANIADTGLTASVTGVQTITDSQGMYYADGVMPGGNPDGEIDSVLNGGYDAPVGGFLSDGSNTKITGMGTLVSLQYRMPFELKPIIGVEYMMGDKGYNFFDIADAALDNFYQVNGNGLHIYYIQPLKGKLTIRLGYRQKTQEWGGANPLSGAVTESLFGEREKLADKHVITTTYAVVNLDF